MGTVAKNGNGCGNGCEKKILLTLDYQSANLYLCIVKSEGLKAGRRPWLDTANLVKTYQNKRKRIIKWKN